MIAAAGGDPVNERLLSLASGVLPEFTPEQTAAAAVAAGWPAVGIWIDPASWTSAIAADVYARTTDAGIVVLDVEIIWLKPGNEDADHFRIIDAGAAIGARNVLIVNSDPDLDAAARKLARLTDHASARGMRASLEFAAFTEVRGLAAALALLDRTGRADAGLLIDPLHLARTGGAPRDLHGIDARRFAYAQVCDAPSIGPPVTDVEAIVHEALDLRLPVGTGGLPLGELVDVLPDNLPLSVELRSRELRDAFPDPADRARALLASTREGLARLARHAVAA